MKQLDLTDNEIDVAHLQDEFREFPSTLFAWCEARSEAEGAYDLAKAVYEEARSRNYMELKRSGEKLTENHVEAMIDTNEEIISLKRSTFKTKRDMETLKNFVESLRAKKDAMIQISADIRKEK